MVVYSRNDPLMCLSFQSGRCGLRLALFLPPRSLHNFEEITETFLEVEKYCSYHDSKRHQTIYCKSLWKYLEELVRQGVRPYPQGSLRCNAAERFISCSTATHDHLVQGLSDPTPSNGDSGVPPPITPLVFQLSSCILFIKRNNIFLLTISAYSALGLPPLRVPPGSLLHSKMT